MQLEPYVQIICTMKQKSGLMHFCSQNQKIFSLSLVKQRLYNEHTWLLYDASFGSLALVLNELFIL